MENILFIVSSVAALAFGLGWLSPHWSGCRTEKNPLLSIFLCALLLVVWLDIFTPNSAPLKRSR